ncbi:MAG: PAS domain S-box protein [Caldilineaceae bacterium]|nr:PAS domain S-box protein [Caldilineaceae bacterium]
MQRLIAPSSIGTIWRYALFGCLWIVLSDWALARLNLDPPLYSLWQTYKGVIFVTLSTLLLYLLLARAEHQNRITQTELEESEATYRLIFENNPLPMWIYDLETLAFLAVNDAAVDKYGYSREAFLAMTIRDIRPTEDLPLLDQDLSTTTRPLNYAGEWRHRRRDGTVFPVEITSHQLTYEGRAARLVVAYDISERKAAGDALAASEERFRRLAENAQDLIYRYDLLPTPHFSYVSPVAEKMTGYTVEEHYADPHLGMKLIHPDDKPLLAAVIETGPGEDGRLNLRWQRKDGGLMWVEQRNVPIFDEAGRLIAIEGIARDVTAQRQMLEKLRQQSAAVQAAANGIVLTDAKGIIEWVNPAFTELTGYTLEESIGATPRELIYSGMQETSFYKDLWDTILAGKVWRGELINRRKDGSLYTEEQTITPVFNEEGQITHFVGIKQDISERKRVEAEREDLLKRLQAQAEQMAQIMRSVPEGILLLDAEGRVLQANPMATRQIAQLGGVNVGHLLTHLGDQPLAALLAQPSDDRAWREVHTGNRIYEVTSRPVESGPIPAGWVLLIYDATHERTVAEQLQRQERLAAVGQLAAGIAHDFNNTLSVIVMYAGMMRKLSHLTERDHERLATIYQQALHASQMIGQILDFSRRSILEFQPLDLLPLLKEQIKLLRRTLPESIEITFEATPGEYVIRADPTRLAQIVMNLALNARDAMPNGGTLRFALTRMEFVAHQETPLAGMASGNWVRILVSDTGVGMAAEVLARLFEPFFTTKAPGKGTGLGLPQVYGIVHQHNGHIAVSSEVGKGASFLIYLPALDVGRNDLAVASGLAEMAHGQGERILLVEDDPALRTALVELLTLWNYHIQEAANGEDALAYLLKADHPIDLILSDVVMPKMGGVALLHSLGQHKLNVPVILLTGYPMQEELENLSALGLCAWLTKPVDTQQLARAVITVLQTRTKKKAT